MIKSEQASLSVTRIAVITILTIFALSVGVLAASVPIRNVKIVFSDNCEIEVFTTKTVVTDILEENHIVILPEENVMPNLDSEITDNSSRIVITGVTQDVSAVAALAQEGEKIHIDQLLSAYNAIVEKISVVNEKVDGGTKKTTYKVKYQNDIEIERTVVDEEFKKEEKVTETKAKVETTKKDTKTTQNTNVTSRNSNTVDKETAAEIVKSSTSSLASKVANITPTKKTLNASAYSAESCGKAPDQANTASGAIASVWYTVAAGKDYPIGTIIYIPYFKDKPNGGWFVVQDRGGSITNNKIDIYMSTRNECRQFGRRNLECYIYEL